MPGQVNQTLTVSKIGSYQVEAIGDEGCISSLSTAILVGLSDFPTLEWKVIHDKVELNQTKIFQVSATFDPKLYTWTADNGAVIENGQGTNTVRVQFPNANATVNVTVVAENDCGISNKLTQEVEVAPACIAVVVKKTSINITGTTLAGNMLTMSVVADGSNTAAAPITYQWKRNGATITGATQSTFTINNIKKTDSGTYTCAVNNCSNIIVETTAGTIDVINEAILPKGSGVLVGEDCFDIASPINNNATCGLLTIREPNKANFSKSYTYTFTSIGENNKDLRFIINDAEQAVESYEVQKDIPTSLGNRATYTITVKYKQSLLTTVAGRDSNNPVNVTLVALFTTGGVESKLKLDITIKDCDCCTAVTDFEGNRYTAKLFGNACWMTQNLRSTVDKNGTSLGKVYFSAGKTNYAAPIVVTDTNGALDTGTVTYQDRVSVTESRNAFASKFGLYYIPANASKACPEGWHLPNTAEWRNLTKVISGKAMKANNNRYKGNDDSKLGCVWGGFDPIDSNNSGFNALPAGGLTATSGFNSISFGYAAIFNKRDGSNEWVTIYCFDTDLNVNDKFLDGGSVRCVRD